jgi:hypothetical protein
MANLDQQTLNDKIKHIGRLANKLHYMVTNPSNFLSKKLPNFNQKLSSSKWDFKPLPMEFQSNLI